MIPVPHASYQKTMHGRGHSQCWHDVGCFEDADAGCLSIGPTPEAIVYSAAVVWNVLDSVPYYALSTDPTLCKSSGSPNCPKKRSLVPCSVRAHRLVYAEGSSVSGSVHKACTCGWSSAAPVYDYRADKPFRPPWSSLSGPELRHPSHIRQTETT
jgi:hypothetical protein